MKEFFPVLHTAALFSGVSDDELAVMLSYLGARIDTFPKGSRLLRAGEQVEEVGLVLAGSTLIVQEDIWGNRNILSKTGPGQTFAEVFACAPGAVLNVSVEAESAVTVMFLHIRRVLSVCPSACSAPETRWMKWGLCWQAAPLLCRRISGETATSSPRPGRGRPSQRYSPARRERC